MTGRESAAAAAVGAADQPTAEVTAQASEAPATPSTPTGADAAEGTSEASVEGAGLAELVAEDSPWPEDPTTPPHGQPPVEGDEPWPADPTAPQPATNDAAADPAAGATATGRPPAGDDLKVVEGIGPRVEAILQESGIVTLSDLADASPERLRTLLDLAGDQFRIHDPATWPEQAGLAAAGQWDQLATLQSTLSGGTET